MTNCVGNVRWSNLQPKSRTLANKLAHNGTLWRVVFFRSSKHRKLFSTVPFRGPPRYNPRRRSGLAWAPSSALGRLMGPPSPCPSEHPFSSASSSLSESSSSHRSHEDDISIVTGNLSGITVARKSFRPRKADFFLI